MEDFLKELKERWTPYVQEAYLDHAGRLNPTYLNKKAGTRAKANQVQYSAKVVFDVTVFPPHNVENQVTRDMFYKEYVFGKFPSVLDWILYFGTRDLMLTKEALYEYLLK